MRKLISRNWQALAVGAIVASVSIIAAAGAANLITGHDIKNGSLRGKDLHNKTLRAKKLRPGLLAKINDGGPQGATGPAGATGATGPQGTGGVSIGGGGGGDPVTGTHWGVIERNTIGSPVAALRSGPYFLNASGSTVGPPRGEGSLGLEVSRFPSPTPDPTATTEKVDFGDEVDFAGTPISSLNQVAYDVYQTGEDTQGVGDANNLPNITFEINPHVAGKSYTSMVFTPNAAASGVTPGQWSHIDAAADAVSPGGWYFSNGSVAAATGCTQAHFCTLSEAKQALVANHDSSTGDAAISLSVGISKGRDDPFQGAVDDLRINNQVFNFEPLGVQTEAP